MTIRSVLAFIPLEIGIHILFCLSMIKIASSDDMDFEILSPQRPIDIQWSFPHFTNFLSMMHLGIRGSQYGFFEQYQDKFFPNRFNFKWYNVSVYFNNSVLNKNGKNRLNSILHVMKNKNLERLSIETNLLMYLWSENPVFQKEMTKDLAENDLMLSWQLFFLWFTAGSYYFAGDKSSVPDMVVNHDIMSGTYVLLVCSHLRLSGHDDPLCPDPCRRRPCASVPNVATELCFQRSLGLFMKEFYCKCQHGFKWNMFSKKCIPYDLCNTNNVCDSHGTSRCVYILEKMESHCECKTGYMGARCSIIRDPCVETSVASEMSGNMYCNTGQGNTCLGTPGTDRFECICSASWTRDLSFVTHSNCLAFRDLCSARVCQGGDCVSSKDGQLTVCVCPPELTGPDCSDRRSSWARWLPWSSCDPQCGPVRRAVRVRFCLGADCIGQRRQVRLCEPTYCGSHPMFEYASASRWKNSFYQMFAFLFLQIMMLSYICFIATIMFIVVFVPGIASRIAIFIPKM